MTNNQEKIQELSLEMVMGERFSRYSKYIIQERALPDIRDGLKPVQRRILFAMNEDRNTFDKPFRKSAKSVGNVMGNYHPHGDSSIYEAMVRLSQHWKLREPLIEMHGNNGSMDGDPPAAMRYTEARLSKIATEMLRDIDKKTVDMVLNFDDTEYEPTVLPAGFPNLLVNGATGISAGYATAIPTHNLSETIDAAIHLLKHPAASLDELMTFVKGPDFPTGGIMQGLDGIKKAYQTGRGRAVLRSKTTIEPIKGGKQQIVITEIPYEVNKAGLVKKIDEIRLLKKVEGLAEVRDESDREGLRIVVELKRNADAQGILNYLYKNTDLQVSYNFNMVAINNKRPEHVGLKQILQAYIDHRRIVTTKRIQFDLNRAQEREHIVSGLIKALSILDDVIRVIRASENKKDAQNNLVAEFGFTNKQAEAIVSLQLYRLTNTDITALQQEAADLQAKIQRFQSILGDANKLDQVIQTELLAVKKQYGTPRKTEIQAEVQSLKIATSVTVADEEVKVLISHDGYIKRSSLRSYKASDPAENGLKEVDYPIFEETVNTLQHLLIFTNKGNMIYRPVHELVETKWKDTGEHLSQTVGLDSDESILTAFCFADLQQKGRFVFASKQGNIKQTDFTDIKPGKTYRSRASKYINLKGEDNEVILATYVPEADLTTKQVFVVTHAGYGLRYQLTDVPVSGAKAAGVKAVNLKDDDFVAGAALVQEDDQVAMVTQRGAFKRMKVSEVELKNRAIRGIKVLRPLKTRPHKVIFMDSITSHDQVLIQTVDGANVNVIVADYSISDKHSNGSFVLDEETQGAIATVRKLVLTP